jgi:tRNA threonylcarbamoyladenosine biosynthesis protein TsaB
MKGSTRVLCLDTSTSTARVAVVDEAGEALAGAEATAERHSAHVLKLCDDVLRGAAVRPEQLSAIACGAGPGSFTGLRVGLAVAKGLALATGAPLLLVSSLHALALDIARRAAREGADARVVVPCIDAGKGEVYALACPVEAVAAARAAAKPPGGGAGLVGPEEPWRLAPEALAARLAALPGAVVAGNGADRHAAALDAALGAKARRIEVDGPTALSIGALALPRLARGESDDLEKSVPFYGRPPDITVPGKTPKKPLP